MVNSVQNSNQASLSTVLPEEASKALINSKNFLNEVAHQTINNITDITNRSLNNINEPIEKANYSLSKIADNAKQTVTESVGNTASNVNQLTNQSVNIITEKAKNAEDFLLVKGSEFTNSVEGKFQQLEQLSNTVSTEIERTINSLINHQLDSIKLWVDSHPVISWSLKFLSWGINHPIFGLIIFLIGIFLIWQLFKNFAGLIEKGLLATLKAPFNLIASLLKFSFKPLSFLGKNYKEALLSNYQDKQDKLSKLFNRLEAIKQEQDDILQEITAIVSASNK